MEKQKVKEYLSFENARNKRHARLYCKLLEAAYGEGGLARETEVVGHHITFEFRGDVDTVNEIPSADTLLFDHDIMGKVFGRDTLWVMTTLAVKRAEEREEWLEGYMSRGEDLVGEVTP